MRVFWLGLALGVAACADPQGGEAPPQPAQALSPAEALHHSLMVLDSHLDTPAYFHTSGYNFSERGDFDVDGTHVDLPRMKEGGLDGGFWVIYTPQGPLNEASYVAARNMALLRQMSIREMAARYHEDVGLAFTAADAGRLHSEGRKIVYQSMENAYPLGTDVSMLETFYIGGLRMVAPAHFRNSQFADSATDVSPLHGGLSALGEDLVREANRLGMILDGSHASDDAVRDMLALSATPIILSHSGPQGVYNHARNLPDELLLDIAAGGGVIQVNAFGAYLELLTPSAERTAAIAELQARLGSDTSAMDAGTLAEYRRTLRELGREFPPPRSTFEKFMEHLFYTLELVGPDHVGIGADWDGGGGVDGLKDVTYLPRITEALLGAGYSEDDIRKIWGANMIRLLAEAEAARTSALGSPNVLN